MGGLLLALLIFSINAGYWQGFNFAPAWLESGFNSPLPWVLSALLVVVLLAIHYTVRLAAARSLLKGLRKQVARTGIKGNPVGAFLRSTNPWRSIFRKNPAGWGRKSKRQLREVLQATDTYIQTLNDQFTNPSGGETLLAPESKSPTEVSQVAEKSL
jgi:hypothetical protein